MVYVAHGAAIFGEERGTGREVDPSREVQFVGRGKLGGNGIEVPNDE